MKPRMEESGEKKEINFITHDEQTKKKGQNYNVKDQIVLFNHRKEYNQKRLWEHKSYLKWKNAQMGKKSLVIQVWQTKYRKQHLEALKPSNISTSDPPLTSWTDSAQYLSNHERGVQSVFSPAFEGERKS